MNALFSELETKLSTTPGRALSLPGLELRAAAVLVPFVERQGQLHVLFTRRPLTLRTHAGQISFPGGGRDVEDETLLHTALRETEEELGVAREGVRVLGMLDEIPTITRYRVTPFVGVLPKETLFRPSPVEIEEILEVPLSHLLNPKTYRQERRGGGGDMHFFDYQTHTIWGATARILTSLFELAKDLPSLQNFKAP